NDAGRVAHAAADDADLGTTFAHAHGQIQIAQQSPDLRAAIAFDDERNAGLIDRHLIDRYGRLGYAAKHLELGLHAPRRRFDVAANDAHPREPARRRYAGHHAMVVGTLVDQRAAVGLQTFDGVARSGAAGITRGFVVHDLRAVFGEFGHFGERRALDR